MWTSLVVVLLSAAPDAAAMCGPQRKPTDRSCTADADCVAVKRTTDCCGSLKIEGINQQDAARFEAEELVCGRELKKCKCMAAPTRLDDGSRAESKAERIELVCREQVCRTQGAKPPLTSQSVKALPSCPAAQCGPAPATPNWECPDGVSVGGRGPCVRIDGQCRWSRLECP